MQKVLFVCVHNSARSQMAEAFLLNLCGDLYQPESAGLEPTEVNPFVVEVMLEEGIDLRDKKTQSVFDLFKAGRLYEYVITVCDDASEKKCPVFPGLANRLHWPFSDPAALQGSREEILTQLRTIREAIKNKIERFCYCSRKKMTNRTS